MRLDEHADLARLDQLFSDMEARGRELLAADGFAPERISLDRKVEMRYQGQIHECQVDVPPGPVTADTLGAAARFPRAPRTALHLCRTAQRGRTGEPGSDGGRRGGQARLARAAKRRRRSGESADGHARHAVRGRRPLDRHPVYDGGKLLAGDAIAGPSVIEEPTTTIVVRPGWQALLHGSGTYLLTRAAG